MLESGRVVGVLRPPIPGELPGEFPAEGALPPEGTDAPPPRCCALRSESDNPSGKINNKESCLAETMEGTVFHTPGA